MYLLDLTLPDPESNLALDEALLKRAEQQETPLELLRLWESPTPFVVIGRASKRDQEANVLACESAGVPILRRCSGGTAVVAGPGCLMYAIILGYEQYPSLQAIDRAHAYVMGRMQQALSKLNPYVEYRGTCDLALGDQKFSGNSLRCKRRHLLYHGTVLYDFPLNTLQSYLSTTPPRQPDYRRERDHTAFVTNFPHSSAEIRQTILDTWDARELYPDWPQQETQQLVTDRYSRQDWNTRL